MAGNTGIERMVSELRQPLAQLAEYLGPYLPGIHKAWLGRMEKCAVCESSTVLLSDLHVGPRVLDLPAKNPRVYREESQLAGQALAERGIPAECVAVAVSLYVESALPRLVSDRVSGHHWMLALTRWASMYQYFLLSGYSLHEASEREVLEEKIGRAERRVQDFSIGLADEYEAERRRLARDLHDEIGHDLIVLKLYIQVIAMDLNKGEISQVKRKLKESVSLIKHALDSVRHLTFDLGPAIWNEQGFVPAIRFYVRQFATRTGLKVTLRSSRLQGRLPARHETALYKVLQGALANVAAHADAQAVEITLQNSGGTVMMKIKDNGKGFDVEKTLAMAAKCFGLRAMQDRVSLLGGTVAFTSNPGSRRTARRGAIIEFNLPLHETEMP